MMQIEELWELIDRHASVCKTMALPVMSGAESRPDVTAPFLAEDICAPISLPSFDQSAMDGYAFPDRDAGWHGVMLSIGAGDPLSKPLEAGFAARVLTGAPVPPETLFVAMQEDCEVKEQAVRLRESCHAVPGENVRRSGAVISAGDLVLRRGHRLHAGSAALLAALGIHRVPLLPRLKALHIATGRELIPPGQTLPEGKIYDSNGPMMKALLQGHNVACRCLRLGDDPEDLKCAITASVENLLFLSGGSGPGDRDHTRACLEAQGFLIHSSRINSRPGKPLIFATRGRQLAFGLPGNPLSHWVCFHAFVARAIARLYGQEPAALLPVQPALPINDTGDGRRTWTPAHVSCRSGQLAATPLAWLHSGDLRPLAEANALLLDGKSAILTSAFQ